MKFLGVTQIWEIKQSAKFHQIWWHGLGHLLNWYEMTLWRLSAGQKSTSSFTFSLRYSRDIANLLFWVLWACLDSHTQSDTVNLQVTFMSISRLKINFITLIFLEKLQRYANLSFWVLWPCLVKHTQNDSNKS